MMVFGMIRPRGELTTTVREADTLPTEPTRHGKHKFQQTFVIS